MAAYSKRYAANSRALVSTLGPPSTCEHPMAFLRNSATLAGGRSTLHSLQGQELQPFDMDAPHLQRVEALQR